MASSALGRMRGPGCAAWGRAGFFPAVLQPVGISSTLTATFLGRKARF